jgi:sterol desaturase/sphingolipid hydroxylase (fatty acid hydroxylase superfamily)
MNGPEFVTVFVAIPLGFSALDLVERRRSRRRRGSDGPPFKTLLFLFTVFAVYLALQSGGFLLIPKAESMTEQFAALYGAGPGRLETGSPAPGILLTVLVVLLFYLAGLWDYLVHRFVSHHRWFWFTHEYHHLPSQVCVFMPGILVRPFAVFSTLPVFVATVMTAVALLPAFGMPAADRAILQTLLIVQVVVLTGSHSEFLRRWWWVHRLLKRFAITTPQEHALHHAVDLAGNYGNFTTFWDRVFGTYLDPTRVENQGHACGLSYDQDFLGAISMGGVKLSPRIRRRFQVGRYCNLVPRISSAET